MAKLKSQNTKKRKKSHINKEIKFGSNDSWLQLPLKNFLVNHLQKLIVYYNWNSMHEVFSFSKITYQEAQITAAHYK